MITSECYLRFSSEEEAAGAFSIFTEETEDTSWQNRSEAAGCAVSVRSCASEDYDEFSTEAFEEGETLFQRVCFRIASVMPEITFTGRCNVSSEDGYERIRITANTEKDGLCFTLRRYTNRMVGYRIAYWDRREDGSFIKSDFGLEKEGPRKSVPQGHHAAVRRFAVRNVSDVIEDPDVSGFITKNDEELGDDGRFLVRFSGFFTENRVMAETLSERHSEEIIEGFLRLLDEKGYLITDR